MRVAYVCTDAGVPVFGHKGCAIHVRELCTAFTELGARVTLFAASANGAALPALGRVRVVPLPGRRAATPDGRERDAVALNRAAIAALESYGPFELVYERAALFGIAGPRYARRCGVPSVLEVNAPLVEEQRRYRTLVHERVAARLFARALTEATAVAAVSREVAALLSAPAGGRARIGVVPNGVAVERFPARRERPAGAAFTVGFVGSLKPWHGIDVLIDAVAVAVRAVPDLRLLIVGDGPARQALTAQVAALGLTGRVTFTGALAHDDVVRHLIGMDVAAAPYPALEPFYFSPLKVLEYMAAGLPVVASDIGQIPSLMTDGVEGRLLPPGDSVALAQALVDLASDRGGAARMGAAGRARVADGHTWRDVARQVAALAGVALDRTRDEPRRRMA